jgi:hypothetical protein
LAAAFFGPSILTTSIVVYFAGGAATAVSGLVLVLNISILSPVAAPTTLAVTRAFLSSSFRGDLALVVDQEQRVKVTSPSPWMRSDVDDVAANLGFACRPCG